jgi:hypothetical protein
MALSLVGMRSSRRANSARICSRLAPETPSGAFSPDAEPSTVLGRVLPSCNTASKERLTVSCLAKPAVAVWVTACEMTAEIASLIVFLP